MAQNELSSSFSFASRYIHDLKFTDIQRAVTSVMSERGCGATVSQASLEW